LLRLTLHVELMLIILVVNYQLPDEIET
jgi:hypothetical protein